MVVCTSHCVCVLGFHSFVGASGSYSAIAEVSRGIDRWQLVSAQHVGRYRVYIIRGRENIEG
jgi:hypothetical protein